MMDPTDPNIFVCSICFSLPENDPLTSSCCGAVFCQDCISQLKASNRSASCPACRNLSVSFDRNSFLLRLMNSAKFDCRYGCGKNDQGSEIKKHQKICEKRIFSCKYCSFTGIKLKFLSHSTEAHPQEILQLFEESEEINPTKEMRNSRGAIAQIGIIPKFYCGQSAGHRCNNCDSVCGIHDGCNCPPCMELDLKHRKLPKGCLVNSQGRVAYYEDEQFFCGGRFDYSDQKCSKGNMCERCHTLTNDLPYYKHLL